MSDEYQAIEMITGRARRRRWTADERLRIVEETLTCGDSVSAAAHRFDARLVTADARFAIALSATEHGGAAVTLADHTKEPTRT